MSFVELNFEFNKSVELLKCCSWNFWSPFFHLTDENLRFLPVDKSWILRCEIKLIRFLSLDPYFMSIEIMRSLILVEQTYTIIENAFSDFSLFSSLNILASRMNNVKILLKRLVSTTSEETRLVFPLFIKYVSWALKLVISWERSIKIHLNAN